MREGFCCHNISLQVLIFYLIGLRLVGGGKHTYQGRVEVFYNGIWGTVCDDSWEINDANVVCHQLGFEGAVMAAKSAAFGRGEGQIWMDGVQCLGNERSLTECVHNEWGINKCDHSKDAGVICTPGD